MVLSLIRSERFLILAILVGLATFFVEHSLIEAGRTVALIGAAVLVGAIILASMRVAHHAEVLAAKVGDPYGTMILTLSAVLVEVIILAILMSTAGSSPTLVRDTIYSAVMLDINGILGLAALLGGLKHGEQPYNDDSSRTYCVMILTAMGISMIVPEFVPRESWHYYSAFNIVAMITLYTVFLRMQVGPHSYFFSYSYPKTRRVAPAGKPGAAVPADTGGCRVIGLVGGRFGQDRHRIVPAVGGGCAVLLRAIQFAHVRRFQNQIGGDGALPAGDGCLAAQENGDRQRQAGETAPGRAERGVHHVLTGWPR